VDSQREPVFPGQPEGQLEDIGPAAVGQAVSIQMAGPQSGGEHDLDLRPEFDIQVGEVGPFGEIGSLFQAVETAGSVG
jgi:hypothetical protein